MTQPDAYLWRDAVDRNQFLIGVQSGVSNKAYYAWLAVHVDAFSDCFGKETYDKVRALKPSEPVRIKLQLDFAA